MSHTYKKIKYETMGAYASTEERYLYIDYDATSDYVRVFDDTGDLILCFDEWGKFDMGKAIVVALTNSDDERLESLNIDEYLKFFKKVK